MILYFQKVYFRKENVQSMLAWLISPVPVKEKPFLNDDIQKIENQKKSRSIVDEDVGYSVVRRYILYVRYRIQALEHRWKRTWHSILWNKKKVAARYISIRALRHLWFLRSTAFERTDAWSHEMVRAARTELIETSLILNASSSVLRTRNILFWDSA